jgi:general secretion pathway protein D
MDSRKQQLLYWLGTGLLTVLLTGCLGNPAYEEGRTLLSKGKMEEGVVKLEQATREEPGNIEYRSALASQKLEVTQKLLNRADNARLAGQFADAERDYRAALRLDPANPRSTQGLEQTHLDQRHAAEAKEAEALLKKNDVAGAEQIVRTILAQDSGHREARRLIGLIDQQRASTDVVPSGFKMALNKPMTLEFRDAALKSVFEVLARSSGVNFVFDKDVRSDAKVTIFVRNSSLDEVIRLILATQQLERKFLNENSILIYPNNPVKAKDYQNLVVKNFYLANADVKQAQALIKSVVKTRDTFIDEKLNLLVIKDTPDAVRLAEQLIESLDLAEPEVMLDVEVLEVSRSKLLELGLNFPSEIGYGLLTSDITNAVTTATSTVETTTPGGQLLQGNINLHNHPGLTAYVANPAVTLKLLDTDGDSNILANPRIRVRNRQKAKIHIGSKLPVFTTTSTANVGVSASVTYLDVGLKLDVEPQVYLDDEVGIKVGLEVSSVTKEVTGPQGSIAYEVGTRNADTSLRLKNGQTQVLAGLINDEERSSANRLPGLGEIPVLGRLFSSHRNSSSKTEIVLLITPRIIRNVARPDVAAPAISSGTEASIGSRPLTIKAPLNSLSVSGRPTSGGGQNMPEPDATQPEPSPPEPPMGLAPQPQPAVIPAPNMPAPPPSPQQQQPPPQQQPAQPPPPLQQQPPQLQMAPPPNMSTTTGQGSKQ